MIENYNEKIKITEFDAIRIEKLLFAAKQSKKEFNPWHIRLQMLLETAEIVSPEKIAPAYVTMNSKILISDKISKEKMNAVLVFPCSHFENDCENINISVLSPLGLSVLGRQIGDVIEGRLELEKMLYQPEAAGDYQL